LDEKVTYWVEIAEYDLETARAMLQTGRYLYVGFMCHQVIEKMLKAGCAAVRDDEPPYTHNLSRLASLSGLLESMNEEQKSLLDLLGPLNVQARYPASKAQIGRTMTQRLCEDLVQRTAEMLEWIRQRLSSK